jgi:hypothetical protein
MQLGTGGAAVPDPGSTANPIIVSGSIGAVVERNAVRRGTGAGATNFSFRPQLEKRKTV